MDDELRKRIIAILKQVDKSLLRNDSRDVEAYSRAVKSLSQALCELCKVN